MIGEPGVERERERIMVLLGDDQLNQETEDGYTEVFCPRDCRLQHLMLVFTFMELIAIMLFVAKVPDGVNGIECMASRRVGRSLLGLSTTWGRKGSF